MRIIAHISDLHFGKVHRQLDEILLEDLMELRPSLIAISGDLTQRAQNDQFKSAQDYLNRLPAPFIVVPGNHDIPFYDITRRFLLPLHRYKHYISRQMSPLYADEEISVIGVNTARSLVLEAGKISLKQLKQVEKICAELPKKTLRIIVSHHPFLKPPGVPKFRRLVGGAAEAMECFEKCGIDILMSGHFHLCHVCDLRNAYPNLTRPMINVQAGTAISSRTRASPNSYNVLRLDGDHLTITSRTLNGKKFESGSHVSFERKEAGWMKI